MEVCGGFSTSCTEASFKGKESHKTELNLQSLQMWKTEEGSLTQVSTEVFLNLKESHKMVLNPSSPQVQKLEYRLIPISIPGLVQDPQKDIIHDYLGLSIWYLASRIHSPSFLLD